MLPLLREINRRDDVRNAASIVLKVGVLLFGVGLIFVWLTSGSDIAKWRNRRTFDAAVWRSDNSSDITKPYTYDRSWPPRLCMVDDLLASGLLNGLTKEQVIELLGPPNSEQTFEFYYYLGPERAVIRLDNEFLVVKFNVEGKVSDQLLTDG